MLVLRGHSVCYPKILAYLMTNAGNRMVNLLVRGFIYFAVFGNIRSARMKPMLGSLLSARGHKEMLESESIQKLNAVLGCDVLEMDLSAAELKRLLSEFRCHIHSSQSKKRRKAARYTVLYAVDSKRLSYALHHGQLPGCVCKCRMSDAESGRIDAMECLYSL